jgi:hypothetical protein
VIVEGESRRSACALGSCREPRASLYVCSFVKIVVLDEGNVLSLSRTKVSGCDRDLYARGSRMIRSKMLANRRTEMELAIEMK